MNSIERNTWLSKDTAVRAVGTKFDVRRLDNDVEVIVDEGKVVIGAPEILESMQMAVPSTMLHVGAGQTARTTGGSVNLMELPKEGIARKLAWQNQVLIFDGDSLADVVMQFNRYNDRQLIIADPAPGYPSNRRIFPPHQSRCLH